MLALLATNEEKCVTVLIKILRLCMIQASMANSYTLWTVIRGPSSRRQLNAIT